MADQTDDQTNDQTLEPEAPTHPEPALPPAPPQPAPRYAQQALPQPPAPAPTPAPTVRNPYLAGFFSLFPGLGNVYNGLYLRGITFFVLCFGLIGLAVDTEPPEAVLLVFSIIFTWLFNIFDAYRQATLINYGYTPDVELPQKSRIPTWSSGGLVAGVAVFMLGLYGLLKDRFDIDLTVLVEYWYVFFMAFGAFLVAQTMMQKRRAEEAVSEEDGLEL